PSTSFCGNGVVEEGEECDAGFITGALDKCCTYDCKLKPAADCSDQNEPCCNRCKLVQRGVKCRDEHPLDCLSAAYCTGYSGRCPKSGFLADGTECLDHGKCWSGRCQPFCETRNLHSCVCENAVDACKRCCSVTPLPNVTCIPYNATATLTDGTPCIRGYCERGICKHSGRDVARRFWHIIQSRDVNAFGL
ncbi:ADAM 17-like protease, partial [Leptotrombidium deliense]